MEEIQDGFLDGLDVAELYLRKTKRLIMGALGFDERRNRFNAIMKNIGIFTAGLVIGWILRGNSNKNTIKNVV